MNTTSSFTKQFAAMIMVFSLVSPLLAFGRITKGELKPLSEEQKILHVLNRLGFGARPGDLEKVKAIGIQKYIEQQLDPASIDDRVAESKVKGLDIFSMSTSELFAKYPNPATSSTTRRRPQQSDKQQSRCRSECEKSACRTGAAKGSRRHDTGRAA